MLHAFSRSELLLGKEAMTRLYNSKVAVFGIGGVGSYTVEALTRTGIGSFVLIDDDSICLTNINRQIIATRSTVGKAKVDVMRDRILDINPKAKVITHRLFYLPGESSDIIEGCDYIVDAIDTVSAKLGLIEEAKRLNIPIISAMGCGDKLDPTRFEVADIYKTSVCPLCRVVRTELRKRGLDRLKVVYSQEKSAEHLEEDSKCGKNCICPPDTTRKCENRRRVPGSLAFVPSVAGLIIAGEVVKDLCGELWPAEEK